MRTDSEIATKKAVWAAVGSALLLGAVAWLWGNTSWPVHLGVRADVGTGAAAEGASSTGDAGARELHVVLTGQDDQDLVGDPEPRIADAVTALGPQRALAVVDEVLRDAQGDGALRGDRAATALTYIAEELPAAAASPLAVAGGVLLSDSMDDPVAFARERIRSAERAMSDAPG